MMGMMGITGRPRDNGELEHIARDLRAIYGAYAYLRDHDLTRVSTTSRLLREADLVRLAGRVRDELGELRGVIDGTHSHGHGRDDVVLEAYQSLYWLTVLAVAAGDTYDDVRPHIALEQEKPSAPTPLPVRGRGVGAEDSVSGLEDLDSADAARRQGAVRHAMACLADLCGQAGVAVAEPVGRDLCELRARSYLAPYWEAMDA